MNVTIIAKFYNVLLLRYPFSILMPIPGCSVWASLVIMTSLMSLYATHLISTIDIDEHANRKSKS